MRVLLVAVLAIISCLHASQAAVSSKKGVGIHSNAFKCGDTWKFTGVSWWYDWRWDQGERLWAHCPHSPKPNYIPMIFNEKSAREAHIPKEAKYVLGFNEPDHPSQAHMTPEQCAKAWPLLQQKAGNRILIGPALTACDQFLDGCIKWYATFFQHCHNCRVDAIAIHSYRCNAAWLMNAVNQLHSHFHRKIWVTEIGCLGHHTADQFLHYMKTLLPQLERSPHVEKYAWWVNRLPQSDKNIGTELMEHNGSRLSKLGQFYNSFHV